MKVVEFSLLCIPPFFFFERLFVYHLILQTEEFFMIKYIFIYLRVYKPLGPNVKLIFQ